MTEEPFFVKHQRKRWNKKAKEDYEKVKDRVGDKGEPYRWFGDARILWPDDKVTRYKTWKGAQKALKRKGYGRWCGDLKKDFAVIITDVWAERWYKEG